MKVPFLTPRLLGPRYDEHTVPLEVLRDLAAFTDFVVEVARALYLQEHPGRKRLPRGMLQGFSLHLSAIGKGSAQPVIERIVPDQLLPHDPDFFEQARDLILETIDAASAGRELPLSFPPGLTRYFDQFGRSLRPGESMELTTPVRPGVVRYDRQTRKRLVLTGAPGYSADAELRGAISEADVEKSSYSLTLPDGVRVSGSFPSELRSVVVQALGEVESAKVVVRGTAYFDKEDRVRRIEGTSHIEILDPNDLTVRLEELATVREGWLDGEGVAPSREGLQWLEDRWTRSFPDDLPNPFAYPTPEGGVQLEWTIGVWEIAVAIDLGAKVAEFLATNTETGDLDTAEVDLDDDEGWVRLAQKLRSRRSE